MESHNAPLKGNVNHSVCRWCFGDIPLDELCTAVKGMGLKAIDLVGPADWPILKKHGLYSSMCNGAEINLTDGWNDPAFHPILIENYKKMIPLVAEAGYKNLICFSGSRRGKDDETGWNNCVEGLKQVLPLAEKHNVVLVMELLNSKVDHKDYQCDHTAWGANWLKDWAPKTLNYYTTSIICKLTKVTLFITSGLIIHILHITTLLVYRAEMK
ncbi:TIM barrel protein [Pedobacter sp. NJ-S-72]